MAKNREMLKEAIAEAKAVKEAAIANAKVALEEAFTPQLKSMLSMKLQEMEEETNEAMYEEDDTDSMNEETSEPHGNIGAGTPEGEVLGFHEEEEMDTGMEVDLEELLAELEKEDEETLNEAEEEEAEEEEAEEEEEEGDTEMEDLSDDELKEMIEDVIAQMIKDGELEAGPEFEGEEEGEEMEMDAEEEEEVDLAELLKEIEEMEKDEMKEEKEEVNELVGRLRKFLYGAAADPIETMNEYYPGLYQKLIPHKGDKEKIMQIIGDETDLLSGKSKLKSDTGKTFGNVLANFLEKLGVERDWSKWSSGNSGPMSVLTTEDEKEEELKEAYKTIDKLRSELNEINLLNAKLLYTNKIFKSKNLNENQKVKVLSSFDKAKNVGEVKMVFETLNEGIKVKKDTIKENLGRASKATTIPTTKKPIVESNDVFLRMQKLAGIIK